MKRWRLPLGLGTIILWACAALAQPPEEREGPSREGPPTRRGMGRGRNDQGPPGGPPRWRLGSVIPPPVERQLNLTEDQQAQLRDLEKEVRDRVLKMLTDEQKKKLQGLQRRGAAGPPPGDRGGPPDRDGSAEPPDRPDGPEAPLAAGTAVAGGIQWFSTWASGLREAERTGRPILLVSGAPHCSGVPGTW